MESRFERPQYADIRKRYISGPKVKVGEEKEMSAIYGAEHFLRMLGLYSYSGIMDIKLTGSVPVSLPAMIAASTMDPESVIVLRDYVHLLMEYVSPFLLK